MTIRFAAASPQYNPVLARILGAQWRRRAANDNALGICTDQVLKAALRHFAQYGLGAAEQARRLAETAFFAGDNDEYRWWLAICRTLDKRMAAAIAARMAPTTNEIAGIPAGNLA